MKATNKDFKGLAPRAARQARVFFFCGPDDAGANDAAHTIAALLDDPGERIELGGAELKRDPVKLGDEARSTSLFGESRHIWVRASGDEAHDAVQNLIEGEVEGCPVLIVATSASDKSRTAKLLAGRDDALVAMFWPPDLRSVTGAVRDMADAAGVTLGGDLAERIARAAALDTRLAQSEVTKLALYLDASPQAPRRADAEALEAIGARTEDDGFASLVSAVLGGEAGKVGGELKRMRELGLSPVGVLLAFERRAAQLAQLAAKVGPRGDVQVVLKAEVQARRVFWKDERELGVQVRRWRGKRLTRLVDKLIELHRALLANSQNAELLLAQGLTEIARAAART
ncbi:MULTISPECIES: DNA polymerase III subunit delta [unclassified Novosphingobium]|uniref:DNA polymerase III subunit delta n=1 Tax=unclassified Novosphingobium TaxID=2644732 RepID=UPI000EB94FB0|nr:MULTISPECIES: DNA polymerase III subunit delta [unclassified Novosphingobium]HCF25127.1 DNA polymerase III subunit delta [Novosphingobium sp.]HQV03239.1 DNA polymerase III subunit delta [Novosphingobium sp.]